MGDSLLLQAIQAHNSLLVKEILVQQSGHPINFNSLLAYAMQQCLLYNINDSPHLDEEKRSIVLFLLNSFPDIDCFVHAQISEKSLFAFTFLLTLDGLENTTIDSMSVINLWRSIPHDSPYFLREKALLLIENNHNHNHTNNNNNLLPLSLLQRNAWGLFTCYIQLFGAVAIPKFYALFAIVYAKSGNTLRLQRIREVIAIATELNVQLALTNPSTRQSILNLLCHRFNTDDVDFEQHIIPTLQSLWNHDTEYFHTYIHIIQRSCTRDADELLNDSDLDPFCVENMKKVLLMRWKIYIWIHYKIVAELTQNTIALAQSPSLSTELLSQYYLDACVQRGTVPQTLISIIQDALQPLTIPLPVSFQTNLLRTTMQVPKTHPLLVQKLSYLLSK